MAHPVDRRFSLPLSPLPNLRVLSAGAALPAEAPASLLDLVHWWEAKAAGAVPDRGALDPVEIGPHLPHIALLDVEEDNFRFRLVGGEMQSRYGALRGRSICELLCGHARAETFAEHRACAGGGRPTLAHRTEPTIDGTDQRRYWRLLLPFARNGRAAGILAAMYFGPWRGRLGGSPC